jgi:hypothetical protein
VFLSISFLSLVTLRVKALKKSIRRKEKELNKRIRRVTDQYRKLIAD